MLQVAHAELNRTVVTDGRVKFSHDSMHFAG
jgi:hypothetical protein